MDAQKADCWAETLVELKAVSSSYTLAGQKVVYWAELWEAAMVEMMGRRMECWTAVYLVAYWEL